MIKRDIMINEPQDCKLTLKTPFKEVETDTYMAFIKTPNTGHIEVNNLDLEDIMEFHKHLTNIILEHMDELD